MFPSVKIGDAGYSSPASLSLPLALLLNAVGWPAMGLQQVASKDLAARTPVGCAVQHLSSVLCSPAVILCTWHGEEDKISPIMVHYGGSISGLAQQI